MPTVSIDLKRCDASPFCPVKRVCPKGAVKPVPGGYSVNQSKCTGCGTCVAACPSNAIQQCGFTDAQVLSEVDTLLAPEPVPA